MSIRSILVVESNEQRAGFYATALVERGYEVSRVRSSRSALAALRRTRFDLVCLFGAEVPLDTALPILHQLSIEAE